MWKLFQMSSGVSFTELLRLSCPISISQDARSAVGYQHHHFPRARNRCFQRAIQAEIFVTDLDIFARTTT